MTGRMSQRVFVALGSNLGSSVRIVCEAMDCLQTLSPQIVARSSLWRTSPVACPAGSPPFVNAVVALVPWPGETPPGLLAKLQALEKKFGRETKKVMNEPRPLDLDMLAWGDCQWATGELVLPHPRAHLRRFVLAPLAELASGMIWPGQGQTVRRLLRQLPGHDSVERLPLTGKESSRRRVRNAGLKYRP